MDKDTNVRLFVNVLTQRNWIESVISDEGQPGWPPIWQSKIQNNERKETNKANSKLKNSLGLCTCSFIYLIVN